jgi:hypothetical protein
VSKFIEASKHADWTSEVEAHFAGRNQGERPGANRLLKAAPYGDTAWNSPNPSVRAEQGLQNTAEPNLPGVSLWNDTESRDQLPRETGVNYTPASQAGHTSTDDPFSPSADGFANKTRQRMR